MLLASFARQLMILIINYVLILSFLQKISSLNEKESRSQLEIVLLSVQFSWLEQPKQEKHKAAT